MNKQTIIKTIPARLAFSPHVHVNFTSISRIFASISLVFGDGPPKKAFAAFASQRVVVVTRGPVPTDQTKVFLRSHRPRRLLLLLLGLTLLTWLPANLLTDLPLTSHGICKLRWNMILSKVQNCDDKIVDFRIARLSLLALKPSISSHSKPPTKSSTRHLKCFV